MCERVDGELVDGGAARRRRRARPAPFNCRWFRSGSTPAGRTRGIQP